MLRNISIAAATFLSVVTINAQKNKNTQLERPKLVVGLVVDQMRWDYLYRFYGKYGNDGFKRLLNTGYSLNNVHIPYVPTITALGHTCIYTDQYLRSMELQETTGQIKKQVKEYIVQQMKPFSL